MAVVSNRFDIVSRKIYTILKREYTVFYACQNPQGRGELLINLYNKKNTEGFLEYYGIDIVILSSSFWEKPDERMEDNLVRLINYCTLNDIKIILLLERYRIVSADTKGYQLVGEEDTYGWVCKKISKKVLENKKNLVIECPLTYGYDIKISDLDVLNILCNHNYSAKSFPDKEKEIKPLLIDEVVEFLSTKLLVSGKFSLVEADGSYPNFLRGFSDICDGAEIISRQKGCVFNLIYQLMPDDYFCGERVAKIRLLLGERLATAIPDEIRKKIDYIVPVPKTGMYYAMGLAQKLKIPYMQGLLKESIDARSFQLLDVNVRKVFLKNKISFVKEILNGKSIILVDEAIFTGTTLKLVCRMLWEAGVEHIYLGIPTPPCYTSCSYYVQPKRDMLLEYIRRDMLTEYFGVDAVYFQTVKDFFEEIPNSIELCMECFGGR